jgi:cell division protein FtsL
MVGIILYILYLIISFSIDEYEIDEHITKLETFIVDTQQYNQNALKTIEFMQSTAYKNMVLKEQQSLKNK